MTNTFLNKINPTANRQNNSASPFSSFSSIKKEVQVLKLQVRQNSATH